MALKNWRLGETAKLTEDQPIMNANGTVITKAFKRPPHYRLIADTDDGLSIIAVLTDRDGDGDLEARFGYVPTVTNTVPDPVPPSVDPFDAALRAIVTRVMKVIDDVLKPKPESDPDA